METSQAKRAAEWAVSRTRTRDRKSTRIRQRDETNEKEEDEEEEEDRSGNVNINSSSSSTTTIITTTPVTGYSRNNNGDKQNSVDMSPASTNRSTASAILSNEVSLQTTRNQSFVSRFGLAVRR